MQKARNEFVSKLEEIIKAKELKLNRSMAFGRYKQFFPNDAVMHPAKMDINLLEYLIQNYTKEGETILDPMAGTYSTCVLASLFGRNAIGVDIEEKFYRWGLEAKERVEKHATIMPKGRIEILQGDARELSVLIKNVDLVLTSPPYSEGIGHGGGKKINIITEKRLYLHGKTSYSNNNENIGNLPHGCIDAVITSPPYSEGQFDYKHGIRPENFSPNMKGRRAFLERWKIEYSKNNITNLKHGHMNTVITSSPYAESKKDKQNAEKETYLEAMYKVYTECVLPQQLIVCNPTSKPICEVKVGDFVLTHKGNFKKVTKIIKHEICDDLVKIETRYLEGITLTSNHPILVLKRVDGRRENYDIVRPTNRRGFKYKLGWYPASSVRRGDYLVLPRLKPEEDIEVIDLLKGYNGRYMKTMLIHRKLSTDRNKHLHEIAREVGCSESLVYMVKNRRFSRDNFKTLINVNDDFLELCGWYVAEGCIANNAQICFALGGLEEVKRVSELCQKVFGVKVNVQKRSDRSHIVTFGNPVIARFFKRNFMSGARNKQLPSWLILLPQQKLIPFLKGYWLGDGSRSKSSHAQVSFATVSDKLKEQLKVVLLKIGCIPSIYKDKKGYWRISVGGKFLNVLSSFVGERKRPKFAFNLGWVDKNYAYIPITRVSRVNYRGEVYNLEVEDDNSYFASSATLHNCYKVLKPGGRAILVIKPFVRRKQVVDLPYETYLLLKSVGFKLVELLKFRLEKLSFWRLLYYRRFPDVPVITHEYILVVEKPSEQALI